MSLPTAGRQFGGTAHKLLYARGLLPVVTPPLESPNPGDLPSADGPDAKGVPHYVGRFREWTLEIEYTGTSADQGSFYLEGSLDSESWSPVSYYTLSDGVLVPSTSALTVPINSRLLIGLNRDLAILAVRPVFWVSDADAGDYCIIRTLERI